MYQSIDDDPKEDAAETQDRPILLWMAGAAIIAALLIAAWLNGAASNRIATQVDPLSPEPEARAAYLRALSETHPPLRRARLTDFISQYPENPRLGSAHAQLEVLNQAADRDWLNTLTKAYDPRLDIETRRVAVQDYRQKWGRYLGSRDEDINVMMEELDRLEIEDGPPDRTLPRDPDAYAGIPDDRLEGGPYDRIRRSARSRPRIEYRPSNPWPDQREDWEIIGPRIVRNVTPRYPSRALRRGIEATVVLSMDIDEQGEVESTELISVDADRYARDFVRAAERAALRTLFEPKTVGGVPVDAQGVQKRYRFRLDD